MDNNNKKIVKLIEKKRAELIQLVNNKNTIDDNIVKTSQELDLLLNKFNNKQKNRKAQ